MAAAVAAARRRSLMKTENYTPTESNESDCHSVNSLAETPSGKSSIANRENQTGFWKYQDQVYSFYAQPSVEIAVACIIAANFLTNILEKQIDPEKEFQKYGPTWSAFSDTYNVIFLFELLVNMYGSWLYMFWKDGWNVFDFVVVSLGFLDLCRVDLPGPLSLLRMMRAFRVFRLFNRVESLKKILVSIARAVPGVLNAFMILLIVMSIYAIIGVSMFKYEYRYIDSAGNQVEYTSSRGNPYGDEYFGNFFKSLYTMFQVLTGESWSEAIARPLLNNINRDDGGKDDQRKWNGKAAMSAIFFVSFQLLCSMVLINVVIAVLLEKMVDPESNPTTDIATEDDDDQSFNPSGALVYTDGNDDESIKPSGAQVYPELLDTVDESEEEQPNSRIVTNAIEEEIILQDVNEKLANISCNLDIFKEDMCREIREIQRNSKSADEALMAKTEEIKSMLRKLASSNENIEPLASLNTTANNSFEMKEITVTDLANSTSISSDE